MRGEIIGGRAGRRRDQHAVGDQFRHRLGAVDEDAQLGDLRGLAQQRHVVDGVRAEFAAAAVDGLHQQRMNDRALGGGDSLAEAALAIGVHQKADRAAVHAVDRLAVAQKSMQRAQHQAVAAERDDAVRLLRGDGAIFGDQPFARLLGLGRAGGQKGQRLGGVRLPAARAFVDARAHWPTLRSRRAPEAGDDNPACHTPAARGRKRGAMGRCVRPYLQGVSFFAAGAPDAAVAAAWSSGQLAQS